MKNKLFKILVLSAFFLTSFSNVEITSACACGEVDTMDMTNLKFYYPGNLDINYSENEDVPILKKIRNLKNEQPGILNLIKDGLFDKTKLTNLNLLNISLMEDKDFGYLINVDFRESQISGSENWEGWNRDYTLPFPYTIKNYPKNEEIIEITSQFSKDYGLNLSNYGKPFVQENVQKMYRESIDKASFFVPEMVTVIYPMLLNGKEVYDESGNMNALNITVDLRQKRVSGFWNLNYSSYENSTLKAETDEKVLKNMIQDGGMYPMYYYGDDVKTKTLMLEKPKEIYLLTSKYFNTQIYEVYVPALLFKIQNIKEDMMLYQQNIVIPLVKLNEEVIEIKVEDEIVPTPFN